MASAVLRASDDYVLDPGSQQILRAPGASHKQGTAALPHLELRCRLVSKVLDEQTMALTDGALDVGGAEPCG